MPSEEVDGESTHALAQRRVSSASTSQTSELPAEPRESAGLAAARLHTRCYSHSAVRTAAQLQPYAEVGFRGSPRSASGGAFRACCVVVVASSDRLDVSAILIAVVLDFVDFLARFLKFVLSVLVNFLQ